MNYQNHYINLIEKASERGIGDESHHIVPRCMGGDDDPSNLVRLTYKEHCFAHNLLRKMFPDEIGLQVAYFLMTWEYHGSRFYGKFREEYVKNMSIKIRDAYARKYGFQNYAHQCFVLYNEFMNGARTIDIREKYGMSKSNARNSINYYARITGFVEELTLERKRRFAIARKIVRNNFTPEQEARRVAAVRAIDRTLLDRKLSIERTGKGNPVYGKHWKHEIVVCPHCHKEGGGGSMRRWHFDNCPHRKLSEGNYNESES